MHPNDTRFALSRRIVRCVKALQLSYQKSIATPANWPHNHSDMLVGGKRTGEFKGSVFLLPTVSDEEAKSNYPGFHTCELPSEKPYLRLVKAEDVGFEMPPAQPGCAEVCSIM